MAELENTHMMPKFVAFLSSLLQRTAESNDSTQRFGMQQKVTVFHGLTKPTISVRSYLERIFLYANCSPSCYVIAYIYLHRFTQWQPLITVNSFNVHRLLITSVMVAAKFMDDICYNNAHFAKVGGISTLEMNFLERDLLFGMNFRLNVTPDTFVSYCTYLQREMEFESPSYPVRLHCFFTDDEQPANHQQQQKQLAV